MKFLLLIFVPTSAQAAWFSRATPAPDPATGHIEFEQCYTDFRNHFTQYFHYEKIAEKIAGQFLAHRATMQYRP